MLAPNASADGSQALQSSSYSPGGTMAPTTQYAQVTPPAQSMFGSTNTSGISSYAPNMAPTQQQPQAATTNSNTFSPGNIPGTTGSSVKNSINNFGSDYLGTAQGAGTIDAEVGGQLGSSFASPAANAALGIQSSAEGASTGLSGIINGGGAGASAIAEDGGLGAAATGASLTSVLGAGGIGALAGGYLANAFGENSTGGSIGGGLGAAAGEAFGGAAASALGLELGSFAGPIGAVAGGVLGSVVGGLFGGKPTDGTEVGGVSLGNGQVNSVYQNQESDTGGKYSSTNANISQQAQTGASNLAQYLIANGATPKGTTSENNLVIKVGSRDGDQIGTQTSSAAPNYTSNLKAGASTSDLNGAVSNTVLGQYNIPASLQTKLNGMDLNSFYATNGSGTVNGYTAPTSPTIAAKQTPTSSFADFVKSYNSNGNNANAAASSTNNQIQTVS